MKPLTSYFECEGGGGAMPSNTLGAGNPGLVGPSTMSEPLTQGEINRQPTAKTKVEDPVTSKTKKNKKKKHMKDLKEHLIEKINEELENISEARTNGYVEWEVYDRSPEWDHKKARFNAKDLYDAVYELTKHLHLFILNDDLDDPEFEFYAAPNDPKAKRDKMAQNIIDEIEGSNGDGCDYILNFTWNRKTYIEGENYNEEEIW